MYLYIRFTEYYTRAWLMTSNWSTPMIHEKYYFIKKSRDVDLYSAVEKPRIYQLDTLTVFTYSSQYSSDTVFTIHWKHKYIVNPFCFITELIVKFLIRNWNSHTSLKNCVCVWLLNNIHTYCSFLALAVNKKWGDVSINRKLSVWLSIRVSLNY